jgi:hypothetical protein
MAIIRQGKTLAFRPLSAVQLSPARQNPVINTVSFTLAKAAKVK